jgi:hypothetical protein
MQKFTFTLFLLILCCFAKAGQMPLPTDDLPENNFSAYFEKAYQLHPGIPKGILEAVAYTNTHFHHITHQPGEEGSCAGLPNYYGVMGLVADGKNYFRNNLSLVSAYSGISATEIMSDSEKNILAYAFAFDALLFNQGDISKTSEQEWTYALCALSEFPDHGNLQNDYAVNVNLYSVFRFLNDPTCAAKYNFPQYNMDLAKVFGEENLKVLSSPFVTVSGNKISNKNGNNFKGGNLPVVQSPDYPPAAWVASPNYNSRAAAISAVTIHDIEGSYAGAISWFQNTSSQVSAHYVVRSSDGAITQMVLESNRAWHVGSENDYTVGIEHEGYANQTGWYTTAMYNSSAALVADICSSNGIAPLRTGFWPWMSTTYYSQSAIPGTCAKVKGHQHYPNQTHTDPGPNWNWDFFYKKINTQPAATVYTTATGTIYDSGGAGGNYSDDERKVWTISPGGATSVSLTFSSFVTENTWDYLYVYDGTDVWAPLIGYFTGNTSPGTLVASSGSMTLEFRSDCITNAAGWNATWASNATTITPTNLAVAGLGCPSLGVNLNWQNSGANWVVDVSDDPGYAYFWSKGVTNMTTVGCPGSFALNSNPSSFLAFQPSTVYYWRIWDGTSHTAGAPFTTPNCVYMDTSCSGNFGDTGGPSAAYSGNEDWTDIIQPGFATSVTINFTSFDLETNFDSLWIYDGLPGSTLMGIYTGTVSPGTKTAMSGKMSVRFKSDPFVNNAGWISTWSCVSTTGINEPDSSDDVSVFPNPSSGAFQVQSSKFKVHNIVITNVLGEIVFSKTLNPEQGTVNCDLGEHVNGMYFYEVKGSEKIIGKGKLIVE